MKLIKVICDKITEEINDATEYAKLALAEKDSHPWLADTLYSISLDEMKHMSILHGDVVKLIDEHRKNVGEPPANMMAVYEYLHDKHIEAAKDAKLYQEMYHS